MKVLEVMHNKTTSTMQQGIGTNHKSLQMQENNPNSLQKQHGYKIQKLHKHGYKFKVKNKLNRRIINFNQCITRFKHRIKTYSQKFKPNN